MLSVAAVEAELTTLLIRFGLSLASVGEHAAIPGSYWGDTEAGLIGAQLFVSPNTPLHSVLHEASHFVCMDAQRRAGLHRDAGGDHTEENAVCYLQILLSDHIREFGRARMFDDMDAWGYTFRLGSAREWFERDADDAREWLQRHGLIDTTGRVTWRVRQ